MQVVKELKRRQVPFSRFGVENRLCGPSRLMASPGLGGLGLQGAARPQTHLSLTGTIIDRASGKLHLNPKNRHNAFDWKRDGTTGDGPETPFTAGAQTRKTLTCRTISSTG